MPDIPHPIDVRVGAALRRERKAAGWSQERLATTIGVSFQQLQKYERGTNRISASKLFDACRALEVPLPTLFGEAESELEGAELEPHVLAGLQRLSPAGRKAIRVVVEALGEGAEPAVAPRPDDAMVR